MLSSRLVHNFAGVLPFVAVAALCGGCDLHQMMANGVGDLMQAAGPKLEGHWDPELVMAGTPSGIMQLEAMHSLSPQNPAINQELAKAYVGYGFAEVEFDIMVLEAEGELEAADRQRHRARLLYTRARDLALAAMRDHDEGIDAALEGGPKALTSYLGQHYAERESLAPLFWTALAWGSLINVSGDFPDIVADMPLPKAMAEHVVAVDPAYGHGSALAFVGGFECGFPEMFGGSLERGSAQFERALKLTDRRAHTVHLQYARLCALNARNRELYVSLLTEIIEAPDQGREVRMANKIARHRAEWYLGRVGDEF